MCVLGGFMSSKLFKYGFLAVASIGAILLGTCKFTNLKNLQKELAKMLDNKAKSRLHPEKINFC